MESIYVGGRILNTADWLEYVYPMPRETRSFEEWRRVRHLDLRDFPDAELDLEEDVLRQRLREDRTSSRVWLEERREAVKAERSRRTQGRTPAPQQANAAAGASLPPGPAFRAAGRSFTAQRPQRWQPPTNAEVQRG